jgi:DNA repair protein RadA/Sms
MIARCRDCRTPLPAGKLQCPNPRCRTWNIKEVPKNIDDSTILLSDVVGEPVGRIKTGLVDLVFGGGIAETSVTLLGGEPGAGKTTLCLQLSDVFARLFDRETLYIANEQSHKEISDTAERLSLTHRHRIRIVKAMGGVTHDIGDLLRHYKPCFTILDSLTKWVGEDLVLAVVVAQRLKDYAVLLNHPIIIINQVNKGGDHAGLEKLQHAVDTTMMFDILEGELDEEGKLLPPKLSPRQLHSIKNRFGPAPEEQFFQMTQTGLIPTEVTKL